VLRVLVEKDLDLLRSRVGSHFNDKSLPHLSQETIQETLRLISPTNHESSFGRLGRWHSFLYTMTRSVLPKTVIETGVLYGHSSACVLAALEDNRKGKLISIDLPVGEHQTVVIGRQHVQVGISSDELSIGSAVPNSLRQRWTLRFGNSLDILPKILNDVAPVSMFIHDSLHTYDHMMAEFRLGYDALEPGGFLISDDIGYNSAWQDFCRSRKEEWKELSKGLDENDKFGFLIKSSG